MIIDINSNKIKSDNRLSNLFVNANFSNLSINCNILKANFFLIHFTIFQLLKIMKHFHLYLPEILTIFPIFIQKNFLIILKILKIH